LNTTRHRPSLSALSCAVLKSRSFPALATLFLGKEANARIAVTAAAVIVAERRNGDTAFGLCPQLLALVDEPANEVAVSTSASPQRSTVSHPAREARSSETFVI
jgi:hypothetical protein